MSILDELQPTRRQRVYDLVHDAGVDVSDWERTKGNSKSAALNPSYCFNYSFIGEKALVVNLWHDKMVEEGGIVRYTFHPRRSIENATRKKLQLARHLDRTLRIAMTSSRPIRAIVISGTRKDAGAKKTSVKRRLLDPIAWSVEAFDEVNDRCTLVRRKPQPSFIDQWDEGTMYPKKKTVTSEVTERCPKIRRKALARANGYCQYCDTPGFTTSDGNIFLETHHVKPLSEGGPDTLDNVVALCPNHHREAHHGATQGSIRQQLLAYLATV
jgi:predicted HNH restriction endonuclease